MIRTSMNLFKAWCNQHVAGNAHVQYRLLASSPSVDDKPVLYYTKWGWQTVRLVHGVPCFIINNILKIFCTLYEYNVCIKIHNLIYTGLRFFSWLKKVLLVCGSWCVGLLVLVCWSVGLGVLVCVFVCVCWSVGLGVLVCGSWCVGLLVLVCWSVGVGGAISPSLLTCGLVLVEVMSYFDFFVHYMNCLLVCVHHPKKWVRLGNFIK